MTHFVKNPFTPSERHLSSSFQGFKLCPDSLPYDSIDLKETERVQVVEKDEFNSYYHLWLMKLHNYFIPDPWDPNNVYWFSEKFHVMKGTVSEDGKPKVSQVFEARGPSIYIWARMAGVYASFIFISRYYCLFTSGIGDLFLIHTGNRTSGPEEWTIVLTMCLDKPPEKASSCLKLGYHPTILVEAVLKEDMQTLQIASLVLKPTNKKTEQKDKRTISSTVKFYTVVFSYPIPAPNPPDKEEDDELEYTWDLHFALGSEAIPQFVTIVEDYLAVFIDRDLQGSAFEKDKVRASRHYDFGYQDMKQQDNYGWQQTSNELNIVVDTPTDVDKDEIVCEIRKGFFKVGLSDGTVFVEGETFKELDTEACFWTYNAEHHLVELLLTKEVKDSWKQVFKEPPKPPSSESSSDEDEKSSKSKSKRKGKMYHGLKSALRMPKLRRPKPLFFADFSRRDNKPPPPRKRAVLLTIGDEDNEEDDCTTLFTMDNKGYCPQRLPINNQIWFSVNLGHLLPVCFATAYNDDTLFWLPFINQTERTRLMESGDPEEQVVLLRCQHAATFNGLAKEQFSKQNRKYVVCDTNLKYACISDSSSAVSIYCQSSLTDPTTKMYELKLPDLSKDMSTIYGLHASKKGYAMVLRRGTFGVIKIG